MTWTNDLDLYDGLPQLRAVGWLSRGKPYPAGEVSVEWFERLCQLLQNPWGPGPVAAGLHDCDLCQFTGGATATYKQYQIPSRSASELYIPADGFLYVSPVSIAHYVDGHGYLPPEGFQRAVFNCPPMRSVAYLKAILANGGKGLRSEAK